MSLRVAALVASAVLCTLPVTTGFSVAVPGVLAARGVPVTVVERMGAPGGKLRPVDVGGVPVDAGPTVFTHRPVFERIFADAGNSSVYEQVLQFLVKGTSKEGSAWSAESALSLQELETAQVLRNMHIFQRDVQPKDMYQRLEYVHLDQLPELYLRTAAATPTLDSYTEQDAQGAPQFCACSQAQRDKLKSLCDHRRRLRRPEYSLASKVRCQDLRQLPCTAQGVTQLLDDRAWMDTPFLTQDELLYLVLLVFQYEISYTASGGFTTLHRLRDPERAQFVDELFGDALPLGDQLSLHEVRQFNEFLDQHDSSSIKCPPAPLRIDQETNTRHPQRRPGRDALRERPDTPVHRRLSRSVGEKVHLRHVVGEGCKLGEPRLEGLEPEPTARERVLEREHERCAVFEERQREARHADHVRGRRIHVAHENRVARPRVGRRGRSGQGRLHGGRLFKFGTLPQSGSAAPSHGRVGAWRAEHQRDRLLDAHLQGFRDA
jgi:hypothetical protein